MSLGMVAVLCYLAHIIIGGLLWPGYSHLHQPISDITAANAPSRDIALPLSVAYGVLAFIFALSFWFYEGIGYAKAIFWGGLCFVALHFVSLLYGLFPEDLPGSPTSFQGAMHIIITALIVPFTILTPLLTGIGFVKEKSWQTFGVYSILTGVFIIIFGTATGISYAKKFYYFGLVERINIGLLQVWTALLSYRLFSANS